MIAEPNNLNRFGYSRECMDVNCVLHIECPNVACQKHRTDYATDMNHVPGFVASNKQLVILK
jgi:hypothetical protein